METPPVVPAARARAWTAGHVLMPLGAALCLLPVVSTGVALLAGLCVALTVGNPYSTRTRALTPRLLSLAVVGLGAGMDLRTVLTAGREGLGYTVVGIALCLTLGTVLARLLGVPRVTGLLISVGTAICGGSAIAAVVPVLRPQEHETSVALGTVFMLNAVALFVFPVVGHAVGLTPHQFGLWCAMAIHDTSSVVGAALRYGPEALAVATPVKLARALWILPLTVGLAAWQRREGRAVTGKVRRPWFIAGFLGAAAVVTVFPGLKPVGQGVAAVARQLLVVTLFLLGSGLTRETLRAVGLRPLAQAVALWLSMAGLCLGALRLGWAT